jgi:hypothetical protein
MQIKTTEFKQVGKGYKILEKKWMKNETMKYNSRESLEISEKNPLLENSKLKTQN